MLDLTIRYRIHISVLYLFLVLHSLKLSTGRLTPHAIAIGFSLACVTAFNYLFNKATDTKEDRKANKGEHIDDRSARRIYIVSTLFFVVPFGWLWMFPKILPLYVFIGLAGLLYSSRLAFGFRAKDILILKNLWSACLLWAVPIAYTPAILRGQVTTLEHVHFVVVLIIALMIEVFWDMRDVEGDKYAGVHTLPNTFGFGATKCYIGLLGLGGMLVAILNSYPPVAPAGIALLVLLALCVKQSFHAYYYHSIVFVWILGAILAIVVPGWS